MGPDLVSARRWTERDLPFWPQADDLARRQIVETGRYEDLFKKGIIDPAKGVRTALQDAASVAGLLITTEAMITELPKKETPPAMPAGGMEY